jgi:superfamily II DNA/RNA helicase
MLQDPTLEEDLKYILDSITKVQTQKRQTLLFSATMSMHNIDSGRYSREQIFGKFLTADDKEVEVGSEEDAETQFTRTVENLDQKFILVPEVVKHSYLNYILSITKLKKNQQVVVFTSTCRSCHSLAMLLTELSYNVTMLHS